MVATREQRLRYRLRHPDRVRESRAAWLARNPGYAAAKRAERTFGEWLPAEVFAEIHAQSCVSCGKTPAGEADHIVGARQGGRNIRENLQPMCRSCNVRKGAQQRPTYGNQYVTGQQRRLT